MAFNFVNHAEDGTYDHIFPTEAEAFKALTDFLGYVPDILRVGKDYIGHYGNRLCVVPIADSIDDKTATAIREAYNARECGEASAAQTALLEKHGY